MSDNWKISKLDNRLPLKRREKAIIVGLIQKDQTEEEVRDHLDELELLAETAGATTVRRFTQKLSTPDPRSFIGSGKLKEIRDAVEKYDVDIIIFDDDLSPSQSNHIEKTLKRKIIDRSSLILDIFASRAKTAQAKTQVELAQMQYLLPRLRGLWTHLERQRGGIGMRGPGEQEIETDRRIVRDKISLLKKRLEKIDLQNRTRRKNRGKLIRVALVGYTNAGKSTLMNVLAKEKLFAEDKLFATLDTTVRKVVLETTPFLISDTVGFIRKLPHHLIESFKSTLDEVRESDILLHIVDISHPKFEEHIHAVNSTLLDLDAKENVELIIFNKVDLYREKNFDKYIDETTKQELLEELSKRLENEFETDNIFISAKTGENISTLRETIKEKVEEIYKLRYPYQVKQW